MKYNEPEGELYRATVRNELIQLGQQPEYISPYQHIFDKIVKNIFMLSDQIWTSWFGISQGDLNLMPENQRQEIIERLIN